MLGLLAVLTIREILQLSLSYRRYIFNLENLMETALISLTYILMFANLDTQTVRILSGLIILFSWVEAVFLIGGHPRLKTYITMFTKVSKNFGMFLSWFFPLIIAFGLCFYILFHSGDDTNEYFGDPGKSIMKTIIMGLAGEIEFEGISFKTEEGKIIFLIFVFFIMLVFVNLLNGLAVSDIAEIQKEAEIMSHISRVELMCQSESVLLGDPFSFLANFPETKLAKKLPNCNLFSALYRLSCIRRLFSVFGKNKFLLFSERLKRKEAVFHPNISKKEKSGPRKEKNDLILPESILEAAKTLVIKKNTVTEEEETKNRLKEVEKLMKLLANQSNHIIAKLNSQ